MIRTDIDETLAFTALIEMDPNARHMEPHLFAHRRNALLEAWWEQTDERSFWNFARSWIGR